MYHYQYNNIILVTKTKTFYMPGRHSYPINAEGRKPNSQVSPSNTDNMIIFREALNILLHFVSFLKDKDIVF